MTGYKITLPCICMSCDNVLFSYGDDAHHVEHAVACDCKAAQEARKAAGTYGLGWIFECKSCPHYTMARKSQEIIDFDRDEIEEIANGSRRFTIRSVRRKVGDTFYAAGVQFRITEASPISLVDGYSSALEELADSYLPQQYLIRFERV